MLLRDRILILAAIASLLFFQYLWWLFLLVLLALLCLFIFDARYDRVAWLVILVVPLFYISWRFMVFDYYPITSRAMAPAISKQVKLRGTKCIYGGIIITRLSEWPLFKLITYSDREAGESVSRDHRIHLGGWRKPRHDEILAYYTPGDTGHIEVRRCIALPGDTLSLREGRVVLNGKKREADQSLTLLYLTYFSDHKKFRETVRRMGLNITSDAYGTSRNAIYLTLDEPTLRHLRAAGVTDSLEFSQRADRKGLIYLESEMGWSRHDWGPYVLPYRGMTIPWNEENRRLYGPLIRDVEGVSDLSGQTAYTFRLDYYFMVGDNRSRSIDSRHYGPVPMCNIEAKINL